MLKATTALKKISSLTKPIWCISGGQGASKTYSILMLIINHATSNCNRDIYIAGEELTKMKSTVIKDFISIMKECNIYKKTEFVNQTLYRFANGSTIKFLSLDKEDIGKGLRSDIIYINEANRIKWTTYQEITSRAERVIIDFNPNTEFWAHEHIINNPDCDFINLTYKDNEYLSEQERKNIEEYKTKGYDDKGNIINNFWANKWKVYGLGELGFVQGCVFENIEQGEFNPENLPVSYGLDFGSRDPDAMVACAIDRVNSIIYLDEIIYKNNQSTKQLFELIKSSIDTKKLIVADSQATRTITDLESMGLNIIPVKKNQILVDIKLMQGYRIVLSPSSFNMIKEFNSYIWLDKKSETPIDKNNHSIDAARYIIQTILSNISVKKTQKISTFKR